MKSSDMRCDMQRKLDEAVEREKIAKNVISDLRKQLDYAKEHPSRDTAYKIISLYISAPASMTTSERVDYALNKLEKTIIAR